LAAEKTKTRRTTRTITIEEGKRFLEVPGMDSEEASLLGSLSFLAIGNIKDR
jgi:hypothetical protein